MSYITFFSVVSIMNSKTYKKNLKHVIKTTEYVEMKKKGLEYIRGISSTAEQISEIDVELTAMKAIKNSDTIRKAQLKDWINTLKIERKKDPSTRKKRTTMHYQTYMNCLMRMCN